MSGKPLKSLYGVVLYKFEALPESHEMNAEAGESIIAVARSDHEWVVAKPMGYVGDFGLIPVSFVELFEPFTMQQVRKPLDVVLNTLPSARQWQDVEARYQRGLIDLHARWSEKYRNDVVSKVNL